jgi:hypothetical protein
VNLLKSKLRRTTSVFVGALLGLGGLAFIATPASAHHSAVKGTPTCDTATGEWVVDWSVDTFGGANNGKEATAYRFIRAESSPTPVEGIAHTADDADPAFPFPTNVTLHGTQRLPGDTKSASLLVQVKWDNEFSESDPKSGFVEFHGTCTQDAPHPDAQLASSCDGVTVTLANKEDATKDADFTITGSNGYTKNVVVKKGDKPVDVTIPAKNAEKIVVTEKSSDKPVLEGKFEKPADCTPPPAEDKADRVYEVTCDSLIFTIDNTKGTETVTATFTPNKGEAKTLTVKGGAKGSVTFKGVKGLVVTPHETDVDYDAIKWDEQDKPKDCTKSPSPAPSASGEGGGGPSLPVTGAAAGGIAGGAAVLLIIGAVLFFMARRRKVNFTA